MIFIIVAQNIGMAAKYYRKLPFYTLSMNMQLLNGLKFILCLIIIGKFL